MRDSAERSQAGWAPRLPKQGNVFANEGDVNECERVRECS